MDGSTAQGRAGGQGGFEPAPQTIDMASTEELVEAIYRLMSIPRSANRSSTLRNDSGYRTYIITTRRMTSGELLKYRNGLLMALSYHDKRRPKNCSDTAQQRPDANRQRGADFQAGFAGGRGRNRTETAYPARELRRSLRSGATALPLDVRARTAAHPEHSPTNFRRSKRPSSGVACLAISR
jgi:hypothetical protein